MATLYYVSGRPDWAAAAGIPAAAFTVISNESASKIRADFLKHHWSISSVRMATLDEREALPDYEQAIQHFKSDLRQREAQAREAQAREAQAREAQAREAQAREAERVEGERSPQFQREERRLKTCENCGRTIGKLETPRVHENHVVCAQCWSVLREDSLLRDDSLLPTAPAKAKRNLSVTVKRTGNSHEPPQLIIQESSPPAPPQPMPQLLPVQYVVQTPQPPLVQTIERTSKFWKLNILLSAALCIFGTVCLVVANKNGGKDQMTMGAIALVIGLCWFIIARIGAWWFHG